MWRSWAAVRNRRTLATASAHIYVADRDRARKFVSLGSLRSLGTRRYARRKPLFESGRLLMRLPVAAKIALLTAGSTGGSAGSPRPVGGLFVTTKCTSISGGACRIRTGW